MTPRPPRTFAENLPVLFPAVVAGSTAGPLLGGATLRCADHWNDAGDPTHSAGTDARYRPLAPSKLPIAPAQGTGSSPGTNTTTSPKPLAPRLSCTMKSGEESWWVPIAQRR